MVVRAPATRVTGLACWSSATLFVSTWYCLGLFDVGNKLLKDYEPLSSEEDKQNLDQNI